MPRGPRGERRPGDVIGTAIRVARIATGEEPEELDTRDPKAVERGHAGGIKGGKARAQNMTPEQRSEAASKAAKARWQK